MGSHHRKELIQLCRNADFESAADLINETPSVLNEQCGAGETPLFWLAVENEIRSVRFLHGKGADINAVDCGGYTPMMVTAQLGHFELSRLFLDWGATTLALNSDEDDILCILENGPIHSSGQPPSKVEGQGPLSFAEEQLPGVGNLRESLEHYAALRKRELARMRLTESIRRESLEKRREFSVLVRKRWEQEVTDATWPWRAPSEDDEATRPFIRYCLSAIQVDAHRHGISRAIGEARLLGLELDIERASLTARATLLDAQGISNLVVFDGVETDLDSLEIAEIVTMKRPVFILDCRWFGYGSRVSLYFLTSDRRDSFFPEWILSADTVK